VQLKLYNQRADSSSNTGDFIGPDWGDSNGRIIPLNGVATRSGTTLILNFGTGGIGGNRNSSVGDGYYALRFDVDGDGHFETQRTFYRLLGDVDGNRTVDANDQFAVTDAIRRRLRYNAQLDVNRDGVVDNRDLLAVIPQVGRKRIAYWLWLDD
jgi:hypothetical protein